MQDGDDALVTVCYDKVLGEGGFGEVFYSYNPFLGHEYAAKRIKTKNGATEAVRKKY